MPTEEATYLVGLRITTVRTTLVEVSVHLSTCRYAKVDGRVRSKGSKWVVAALDRDAMLRLVAQTKTDNVPTHIACRRCGGAGDDLG
jgi:hypothetical protein